MKFILLKELFEIKYGNQFDFNKMTLDNKGVNFICRSRENLGFKAKVKIIEDVRPFDKGLITVTMGGTYLLSSFVQLEPFYTAQNIKVLKPFKSMDSQVKNFYCIVIEKNRYRFTSHGREANSTFDDLKVPCLEDAELAMKNLEEVRLPSKKPLSHHSVKLFDRKWKQINLGKLFCVSSSTDKLIKDYSNGNTPYVSSTEYNNGVSNYVDAVPTNSGNMLTVNRGGSVGKTFYHENPFLATPVDVRLLKPKFDLNRWIGLFLSVIIENEKYRFNFSRKMGTGRLKDLMINLPVDKNGNPDWQFMEDYIKTFPYSCELRNS
jgi:hypothetical protein